MKKNKEMSESTNNQRKHWAWCVRVSGLEAYDPEFDSQAPI